MDGVRYRSFFILAPPFYSHFRPLLTLAEAISRTGARVIIGCTIDFREEIIEAGIEFSEVVINRNKNRGIAEKTDQLDTEAQRLQDFIEATKRGAVETLITQASHRTADMFANPEELIERIAEVQAEESPDLWIVDQLSYGATLALYGLGLRFITFCAPHPSSIPETGQVYSVPPVWPSAVEPCPDDVRKLEEVARNVEAVFTGIFNDLLDKHFRKKPVRSAFGLCSDRGVIFNYPPFPGIPSGALNPIYAGHSYRPQEIPASWREVIETDRPMIIISLGTFLSSRGDVLLRIAELCLRCIPDALLMIGAGPSVELLADLPSNSVVADGFIPQQALLPYVDLAVHHGGVSSFTETLFAEKPMLVMPFSSDQFNVARDVERMSLGAVLDPNNLTEQGVHAAVTKALGAAVSAPVKRWSETVKKLGPASVVRRIQETGEDHG